MMDFKKIGKAALTGLLAAALAAGLAGCGKDSADGAKSADGKKTITVAHTNYYVPYDYVNEQGESDGFEVAVMKEVAKKLPQYEFKFVPTSDDDLLIGVESGKYTVGTKGIWITDARKKKYVFPQNNIGASVIGLAIRKESFQNADAYSWVMEGRYDGYLEVELSYKNNIEKEDAPYHAFSDKLTYIRYKGIPTYPIFNKKEQAFADEYDKAIEELRAEGKIAELEQKYFGESLSAYLN